MVCIFHYITSVVHTLISTHPYSSSCKGHTVGQWSSDVPAPSSSGSMFFSLLAAVDNNGLTFIHKTKWTSNRAFQICDLISNYKNCKSEIEHQTEQGRCESALNCRMSCPQSSCCQESGGSPAKKKKRKKRPKFSIVSLIEVSRIK